MPSTNTNSIHFHLNSNFPRLFLPSRTSHHPQLSPPHATRAFRYQELTTIESNYNSLSRNTHHLLHTLHTHIYKTMIQPLRTPALYLLRRTIPRPLHRTFTTSSLRFQESAAGVAPTVVKVKKPMGAFRGGFLGFLLGSTLAFGASFTYLREEWKTRDEILMEEFASLRAMCQRVESRFREVEERIEGMDKKKRR